MVRADENIDDEKSYVEEPPETPAPLFAVRAFKTAIFGTPHPDQSNVKRHTPQVEQNDNVAKTQPAEEAKGITVDNAVNDPLGGRAAVSKVEPLASPTKGILLTPGTGPTRRKTVSFGSLIADAQKKEEQSPSTELNRDSAPKSGKDPEVVKTNLRIQPRHSSLTKTLIQQSKQNSNNQAISVKSNEEVPTIEPATKIGAQTQNSDHSPDITVDLSQPRSRSGQHWKTEYEQYHKRSNREMKKMIMYGQNVKSYAVKKDSEATGLGEKLKKELAKVAAMEKKVSKLAAQLNNAYAHSPEGESEQTRLVSELAQQTALAIRYKQKADHYRRAMQKENRADGSDGEGDEIRAMEETSEGLRREADEPEVAARSAQQGSFDTQLETLRMSAKKAEDQAAKLEAENNALKRSLARVKGEMMSYEARRQAREERYKRREAKCKAEQKACEAQLAKLTVEHRNLLLASGQSSNGESLARPQLTASPDDHGRNEGNAKVAESMLADGNKQYPEPVRQNRISKPYVSPRKSRLQKSAVDIWTLSGHKDAADSVTPSKEPTELPPSSVRHDIQRTLKEIDQNLIPEQQHPGTDLKPEPDPPQPDNTHKPLTQKPPQLQPKPSSPIQDKQNPTPKITSPQQQQPIINLTASSSNPANLAPSPPSSLVETTLKPTVNKPSISTSTATFGRSASLLSSRGRGNHSSSGSRTGTMTSALSVERKAAAMKRLAVKSAEKRQGGQGMGMGEGK